MAIDSDGVDNAVRILSRLVLAEETLEATLESRGQPRLPDAGTVRHGQPHHDDRGPAVDTGPDGPAGRRPRRRPVPLGPRAVPGGLQRRPGGEREDPRQRRPLAGVHRRGRQGRDPFGDGRSPGGRRTTSRSAEPLLEDRRQLRRGRRGDGRPLQRAGRRRLRQRRGLLAHAKPHRASPRGAGEPRRDRPGQRHPHGPPELHLRRGLPSPPPGLPAPQRQAAGDRRAGGLPGRPRRRAGSYCAARQAIRRRTPSAIWSRDVV